VSALLIAADGEAMPLSRMALGTEPGFDERWLQQRLFAQPTLIPLERIEPGAGPLIPVFREFALARAGGLVFLDMLGVTRSGRLVLVECKLWRNPQARREVVAQLIEYAALLRGFSFADLTARLKSLLGSSAANPLYELARAAVPGLDEAAFVDAVARSLALGDFHLIIAGDGIRADLQAIGSYLNATLGGAARLALVEIQLWRGSGGQILVVPQLPLRTEVIEQRLVVGVDGVPLRLSSSDDRREVMPATSDGLLGARGQNRAFWQEVIDRLRFDHPDQPAARHGGNNWIRLDLPGGQGLTGYRGGRDLGFVLTLTGEPGAALYDGLATDAATIALEIGLEPVFRIASDEPFKAALSVTRPLTPEFDEPAQQAWLIATANRLVTCLRPRLARLIAQSPP
jgi:hypothetical protein